MEEAFDPYHKWLGIPPKDQPPNHYRLLGVDRLESDLDVIENAADQRMRHVRSFQNGPHQSISQKLLNEISAAKICLLNPDQKSAYDAKLTGPSIPPIATGPAPLVPKPAVVKVPGAAPGIKQPKVNSDRPGANNSPARRKTKNPIVELVKIIVGGVAGLLIGFLILSFLREDWDTLGIAKAVRGSRGSVEEVPVDKDPQPEITPQVDNDKKKPPKVEPPPPPVLKLSPLSGIVEAKPFVWQRGEQPLNLGPPTESFLVTSWFAGYMLGNGEWYTADIDETKNYRLHGSGAQPVGVTVTRVSTPYRAWFEDEVKQFTWRKGNPRIQLIHQHDGFAVLAGASGCFLGPEHVVSLTLDPSDGYWYLDGATNFDTKGQALVYRFKQPGKFRAEVKQIDWKPGDERQKLIPIEEGLCFVSSISGAFKGYGENLNAMAEPDGFWHVWGYSKAGSTRGAFTSIRFNTPELLAMAPGKPNLKVGEKPTPPMPKPVEPKPMPMPEVEVKGPPPDAATVAAAREKLKTLLAESSSTALLASAAEQRPREERYVLFLGARDKAIADGDCRAAMRAIDRLAEKFEVVIFDLQFDALQQLRDTCTTPEANVQLTRTALTAIAQAKADRKEKVLPLAEICITAARKTNDSELNRLATIELLEARKQ